MRPVDFVRRSYLFTRSSGVLRAAVAVAMMHLPVRCNTCITFYHITRTPHRRSVVSALLPYIMSTDPCPAYSAGLNQPINQSRHVKGGGDPSRSEGAVPRSAPRWPRLNSPAIGRMSSGTGFWRCSNWAQDSAVGRTGRHTF